MCEGYYDEGLRKYGMRDINEVRVKGESISEKFGRKISALEFVEKCDYLAEQMAKGGED